LQHLTPREIVSELDKYIVGQADAKRAVAVAIRNRWRRQQLPDDIRADVAPKNILMSGPTGVGKTEIARRLAALVQAPFIKVEATKYTEVGYHGRDVESMIRDLLEVALVMVRNELSSTVEGPAQEQVEERLLDTLLPAGMTPAYGDDDVAERSKRTREKFREQLRSGQLEDRVIEIGVEQKSSAASSLLGAAGLDSDPDLSSMFEKMMPSRRETRRLSVKDARRVMMQQEAEKLVDKDTVTKLAIERTEQAGIIFLDEIDKICGSDGGKGPDVSRQGVQRDLLPIVEGSTVTTKHGQVRTDHILFIAAGAFHSAKPSDLMPELQGRFPIRVELNDLTQQDFVQILTEPHNALTRQTQALLATEGMIVEFTDDGVDEIARVATDANKKTNIGARRLHTIMEQVFEQVSFEAPDLEDKKVRINAMYVRNRLGDILKDERKGWFKL